jgi:GNAT superfamily N-acetyltransferase
VTEESRRGESGAGESGAGESGLELRRVAFDDEAAVPVLAGLSQEYAVRYGEIDEMSYTTAAEFEPPAGTFVVIVQGGRTVAGGGFRRLSDEACEVKRVWTSPQCRRQGLAGLVLDALEGAAAEVGYRTVRLETGPAQPEAEAFYESRGYERIPVYGRYPEAIAFERPLADRS